jgi:hypothetical protein
MELPHSGLLTFVFIFGLIAHSQSWFSGAEKGADIEMR